MRGRRKKKIFYFPLFHFPCSSSFCQPFFLQLTSPQCIIIILIILATYEKKNRDTNILLWNINIGRNKVCSQSLIVFDDYHVNNCAVNKQREKKSLIWKTQKFLFRWNENKKSKKNENNIKICFALFLALVDFLSIFS